MGTTCSDQAILVKTSVKDWTLCHWSPAKVQRPQLRTLKDGDCSKHTMKACVCHIAEERKEVAGEADEHGRCFIAPLRAEYRHRTRKETGWTPQLHSHVNSCLGQESSIKTGRGEHRVDLVLGAGMWQDPDLWLFW